jgi:hypothetical protein
MVKKKIIGMVVCSVLLIGNCTVATESSGSAMQEAVQVAIQQALTTLANQGKLGEILQQAMVQTLPQVAQIPPRPQENAVEPFISVEDVKKYVNRVKSDNVDIRQDLLLRIEQTVNYFLGLGRIPTRVPDEWRKAKIIEILHEIKKSFPMRSLIARCDAIIQEQGGGDPGRYMRLLLMSQCYSSI